MTVLERSPVKLEPLSMDHVDDLLKHGTINEAVWDYLPYNAWQERGDAEAFVDGALREQQEGSRIPFAIIDLASGEAIGSSSYGAIRKLHRSVEIGWTWVSPKFQRTAVNTACKWLLLTHAFEEMGCIRVELKTDQRNIKSQTAIARLGAKKEGVFRNHMILPDGFIRDSVYYSIIDSEWPEVKARLENMLEAIKN